MPSRKIIVERIAYTVSSFDKGKRLRTWARIGNELKQVTATTEERLRKKLRKISVDLLNGEVDAAGLERKDHRSYLAAQEALAEVPGMGVDQAVREFVWARKELGMIGLAEAVREYVWARKELGAISMTEAVRIVQKHGAQRLTPATLEAVRSEFIRIKTRSWSKAYLDAMTYDLARLCLWAPAPGALTLGQTQISEITVQQLENVISETGRMVKGTIRPASDARRKQVRDEIVTLFNYARRKGYLTKTADTAAQALENIHVLTEARPVWDPGTLREALESTAVEDPEWLPWLAISAFANLRSMATRRLVWEELHSAEGLIELVAGKSKVKRRVTVTMSEALQAWLANYWTRTGSIVPAERFENFIERLKKRGFPYYKNVLRKSFITYLLAATDDEQHVAEVANTSVKKLRSNYRQIRTLQGKLVTKELGTSWFSIKPAGKAENVILLAPPV